MNAVQESLPAYTSVRMYQAGTTVTVTLDTFLMMTDGHADKVMCLLKAI